MHQVIAKVPADSKLMNGFVHFFFSATLSMVAAGSVYGWTTTIVSRLTNATEDVPVHISMDESSWVISLTVIGSMIGPFYGAYVAAS
jgi:hypothetical protein